MTLKSLLLGSAAAFAVVGGAQAADLSVAEPVDYVRICDYFGTSYWYIPGTDTCLKIGGRVDFAVNIHALSTTADPSHSSNWDFYTFANLNVTAKSMTEFGELAGFLAIEGYHQGTAANGSLSYTDIWLSLGALKVGHFAGPFVTDGAFTDISPYCCGADKAALRHFDRENKIQLSWAAAGFGLALAVADPSHAFGSALPATWSVPEISGAITASQASWSGKLAAAYVQLSGGAAWGITGSATFNIGANDKLRLNAAYGDDRYTSASGTTTGAPTNNGWTAFASFQHMWSSTLSSAVTVAYAKPDGTNGTNSYWAASGNLVWSPVAGFDAKLRATYASGSSTSTASSWAGQVALTRSW